MGHLWLKATAVAFGFVLLGTSPLKVSAEENNSVETALGGLSYYLNEYYKDNSQETDSLTDLLSIEEVAVPKNIGIANVNDKLNIRKGPGTDTEIVGYLPAKAACFISDISNGWAKITSGNVNGYVSTDYLWYDTQGVEKAKEYGVLTATVNAGRVNLRSEPSTTDQSNILTSVYRDDVFKVLDETILTKDEEADIWIKVTYMETEGYLAKQFMELSYQWNEAIQVEEPKTTSPSTQVSNQANSSKPTYSGANNTELRNTIVATAKQYLGLRYVYGGNSLTSGTDCSGFCLAIYRACGVDTSNIPRSSASMASSSSGRSVSRSELRPGDLLFYGNNNKTVNHVAIYMGNNKIIHESSNSGGVIISDMDYRPYIKAKNFID